MLELLVLAVGTSYLLISKPNTKDDKNNKQKDNKEDFRSITYKKFDNMTTYEIDRWLKECDLYSLYGEYGRETKINKIVDRLAYYK